MIKLFIKLSRWPNLLIIALLQVLVFFRLMVYDHSVLTVTDVVLLILVTICISAAGYIINDYYDSDIDRINKPGTWIAGNQLPLELVLKGYKGIILTGAILALWVAFRLKLVPYLPVYVLAVAGLQFYSARLKCWSIIGNLWVSIFCGGVILIMAAPDLIHRTKDFLKPQFWYYIGFAFITTFYREVVKDIEDEEGDQQEGCKTFVVRYGKQAAQRLALIIALVLAALMANWLMRELPAVVKVGLFLLEVAVLGSGILLWRAKDNSMIHKISTLIKFVMVGGTLLLFI
jgi:4-hydroxybenzoate polyprenyltransferase